MALFSTPDQIDVVVHRESIIHSVVSLRTALKARWAPDSEVAHQYALGPNGSRATSRARISWITLNCILKRPTA